MTSKEAGAFSRGMPYNNNGTTRPEQSTVRVCVRIDQVTYLHTSHTCVKRHTLIPRRPTMSSVVVLYSTIGSCGIMHKYYTLQRY